jgi:quercetin dioxygenase-like cupin family protein
MKASIAALGVLAAVVVATPALSTPGAGVVGPVLARGTLDDRAKLKIRSEASDVVTQHVTIAPGGHTGWHSHPGPAIVVVAAGTLTLYDGDDRKCSPHPFGAGESFIDPGRGHVHIGRNEGAASVELYVTYLDVPIGGPFRIDAADPGNCRF